MFNSSYLLTVRAIVEINIEVCAHFKVIFSSKVSKVTLDQKSILAQETCVGVQSHLFESKACNNARFN